MRFHAHFSWRKLLATSLIAASCAEAMPVQADGIDLQSVATPTPPGETITY